MRNLAVIGSLGRAKACLDKRLREPNAASARGWRLLGEATAVLGNVGVVGVLELVAVSLAGIVGLLVRLVIVRLIIVGKTIVGHPLVVWHA